MRSPRVCVKQPKPGESFLFPCEVSTVLFLSVTTVTLMTDDYEGSWTDPFFYRQCVYVLLVVFIVDSH